MKQLGRTLVVCHDAGGAEVVSSWAKRQSRARFDFVLEGPARKVFERKLGSLEILPWDPFDLKNRKFEKVITGTSWSSDLEKRAIVWSVAEGIKTETFLDHWINYRHRFDVKGTLVLPDKLYVYDEFAKLTAERELNHRHIEIIGNPYWDDMMIEIGVREKLQVAKDPVHPTRILYVTQPIQDVSKIYGSYGYTEFTALDAFLDWLEKEHSSAGELRLRPHPAEGIQKYRDFFSTRPTKFSVTYSEGRELPEDIAWADWVVGCDTMAMVIGLKAKRRVLCSIPKGGKALGIPYPEITRLFL